jgi:hypothetical protein
MNKEKRLPLAAGGFLIAVGGIADAVKFALDMLFGIGVILDPLVISPITWMIFWITLQHNGISMFSGKRGIAGWVNIAIAECPGVDALPDWTVYAIYLTFADRASDVARGIIGG